jgi:hypothetical protein
VASHRTTNRCLDARTRDDGSSGAETAEGVFSRAVAAAAAGEVGPDSPVDAVSAAMLEVLQLFALVLLPPLSLLLLLLALAPPIATLTGSFSTCTANVFPRNVRPSIALTAHSAAVAVANRAVAYLCWWWMGCRKEEISKLSKRVTMNSVTTGYVTA